MDRGAWFIADHSSPWGCKELGMTEQLILSKGLWGFTNGSVVKNMPAIREAQVLFLVQEDALEKKNGNPLQYSCLGNTMNRGAW